MKFKKEIIMGSGKSAYVLACSREEIELLLGIVKTTRHYFPKSFELSRERNRLANILKELEKVYGL